MNDATTLYSTSNRLTEFRNGSDTGLLANMFVYDEAGNVLTRTNRKGEVARYTYDGLNRVGGTS